jgi:hypothetical protein
MERSKAEHKAEIEAFGVSRAGEVERDFLIRETGHKQALKFGEPLVQVDIATRQRWLEKCKRCKQRCVWIDVHVKADIELIERGTK